MWSLVRTRKAWHDLFVSFFVDTRPRLGRWCHVTAPNYKNACNWELKVDMANRDNGSHNSGIAMLQRTGHEETDRRHR
jgi:hypothetical protein